MQWLDEDFEESVDFQLLGMTTHLGSHRLCWELNRVMGWSLAFYKELAPDERAGQPRFVVHRYVSEDTGADVALIANRLPESLLVKKLPRVDFLLRVGFDTPEMEGLKHALRGMRLVSLVVELDAVQTEALEHIAVLDLAPDDAPLL